MPIICLGFLCNFHGASAQCSVDAGPAKDSFSGCSTQLHASIGSYFFDFNNGAQGWSSAIAGNTCTGKTSTNTWSTTKFGYSGGSFGCPNNGTMGAENSYIVSPPLALSGKVNITFRSFSNNESGYPCMYDVEFVEISTDGGKTWTTLNGGSVPYLNNVFNDAKWEYITFTTNVPTTSGALIRFRYDTGDDCCGGTGTNNGWYVDDIAITGGSVRWFPDSGLSCTTCLNPTVSNIYGTKKYYVEFTGAEGCKAIDSIEVTSRDSRMYYRDFDKDGFGDPYNSMSSCTGVPAGYVSVNGDCNDSNASTTIELAEIRVYGKTAEILTGNNAPDTANGTDFGTLEAEGTVVRSYTILNDGTAILKIRSISMSGVDASSFLIMTVPKNLLPGERYTISVKFAPRHGGVNKAWLVITSNDCDERYFKFLLSGRVRCNESHLQPGTPGTYRSRFAETNTQGRTCFCDESGNLLLSVSFANTGVPLSDTMVSLHITVGSAKPDTASSDPSKTSLIAFAAINRTWTFSQGISPDAKLLVRYYFTSYDIEEVNNSLQKMNYDPLSSPSGLTFYKITNPNLTSWSGLAGLSRTDYNTLTNDDQPSDSTWTLGKIGDSLFFADMLVDGNTNGGGAGGMIKYSEIPVEFIGMHANATGKVVNVTWSTASESGAMHYDVLRSTDGVHYSTVGSIPASTNPFVRNDYAFNDSFAPAGITCYYKVKMVESGGKSQLYGPVAARISEGVPTSSVFPIPTRGVLHVETGNPDVAVDFELYTTGGLKIKSGNFSNGAGTLDLEQMSSGTYYLRLNADGQVKVYPVVKI